ncbi:hypothetical protein P4S72_02055 [Vibrio sp. PP-XX7]
MIIEADLWKLGSCGRVIPFSLYGLEAQFQPRGRSNSCHRKQKLLRG